MYRWCAVLVAAGLAACGDNERLGVVIVAGAEDAPAIQGIADLIPADARVQVVTSANPADEPLAGPELRIRVTRSLSCVA